MLSLRDLPLFFSVILMVFSLVGLSSLKSYASNTFDDDEENQKSALQNSVQPISSYQSLEGRVSDSEEEDLDQSPGSVQRGFQNDEEYYECCLGYYRTIPCWTDAAIAITLVGCSIIMPIMTYAPIDESTRLIMGTIGSFTAFSGVLFKVYQWCVLGTTKRLID